MGAHGRSLAVFVYYTPSALASPDLHRIVLGAAWGTWHGAPGRRSRALHGSQGPLTEVSWALMYLLRLSIGRNMYYSV